MVFEIVYGLLIAGLYVLLFRFMMGESDSESSSFRRNVQMEERIKKLEDNARYIADQPQHYVSALSQYNAYRNDINLNEVPINGVVKAIVQHLGMEIEKVAEHTINKPMEVKVVEKQPNVTITGADGFSVWSSPEPMPKPKRKRKTK